MSVRSTSPSTSSQSVMRSGVGWSSDPGSGEGRSRRTRRLELNPRRDLVSVRGRSSIPVPELESRVGPRDGVVLGIDVLVRNRDR